MFLEHTTRRWFVSAIALVSVTTAASASVQAAGPSAVVSPATAPTTTCLAYVANARDNDVSVIDTSTDTLATPNVAVSDYPVGLAISPDGSRLYATSELGEVSVIDTTTKTVSNAIPLPAGATESARMAISPAGDRLYITDTNLDALVAVDLANNNATTIQVGTDPGWVAVSPDGTRAYVSNTASNTVSVIDTDTNSPNVDTEIATVQVGLFPYGLAVHGNSLYVAVSIPASIVEVDLTTNQVATTVSTSPSPFGVAVSPDGTRAYTAHYYDNTIFEVGVISAIDTQTMTVSSTLSVQSIVGNPGFPAALNDVALSPDGARLYVTNTLDESVEVVDTSSAQMRLVSSVAVGRRPRAVAVAPSSTGACYAAAASPTPPPPPPPVVTSAPATTAPDTTAPATSTPVTTVAPGGAPSLVGAANQGVLTRTPGSATALVDGEEVPVQLTSLADDPAAQTPPQQRTPAQVAALQQAATNLVSDLGDGSGLTVVPTPTGAELEGVFTDVAVPVEDVIVVETPETATLFAALDPAGNVVEVQPGAVLEVNGDGEVGVVAFGLMPGEQVELVIMSTPTLLGSFTVSGDGTVRTQAQLPAAIGSGEHTLVMASPTVQASLGLKVAGAQTLPAAGVLPATGAESTGSLPLVVLLVVSGALLALVARRRSIVG